MKKSIDKKLRGYRILSVAAVFLPSIAGIIITGLFCSHTIHHPGELEQGVLGECVAIISLAVAAWVGLSIINTVERSELAELREISKDVQDNMEQLQEQQKAAVRSLILDIEMLFRAFDEEVMYLHLASHFSLALKGEIALELLEKPYTSVRQFHSVVTILIRVVRKYDHQEQSKEFMSRKYDEALDLLSRIEKSNQDLMAIPGIRRSLQFIRAEMNYYMGMFMNEADPEREKYLEQAGDLYIKFYEDFTPRGNDRIKTDQYINNTIAQCYSEIIFGRIKRKKKGQITEIPVEWIQKADYYTTECIDKNDNECEVDMFLKNAGVWHERQAMIVRDASHFKREALDAVLSQIPKFDEASAITWCEERAMSLYEAAIKHSSHSFPTIYRVAISLLNRMVQRKLGGESIFRQEELESLMKRQYTPTTFAETQPMISQMEGYLEIFQKISERPQSFYYDMKAFTLLYNGMIEEKIFADLRGTMSHYVAISRIINGTGSTGLSEAVARIVN